MRGQVCCSSVDRSVGLARTLLCSAARGWNGRRLRLAGRCWGGGRAQPRFGSLFVGCVARVGSWHGAHTSFT